ncbi:MAG: M42 family peptidase, partial [Thermoguttaceae bacterium]|nr:M42 family peptidase [Thermoguttaceae bacterium]
MEEKSREFLNQLLLTPGATGREEAVQEVVRAYAGGFADSVTTDVLGNVIAVRNADAPCRIMLAGHCDQIGLGVRSIDADGFI